MVNLTCEYCGNQFIGSPSRLKAKHICCSKLCMNRLFKEIRENTDGYFNCICPVCNNKFHLKTYYKEKWKTHTCSMECKKKLQSIRMSGEGNHQFGIRGEDNPSWKGGRKVSSYGYILIYMPEHPFCNGDGNIFEHRYIAEQYLLTDENSVVVGGKRYLSKKYVVHHKDGNRKNNDIENLEVMLKGEHSRMHNKEKHKNRTVGQ